MHFDLSFGFIDLNVSRFVKRLATREHSTVLLRHSARAALLEGKASRSNASDRLCLVHDDAVAADTVFGDREPKARPWRRAQRKAAGLQNTGVVGRGAGRAGRAGWVARPGRLRREVRFEGHFLQRAAAGRPSHAPTCLHPNTNKALLLFRYAGVVEVVVEVVVGMMMYPPARTCQPSRRRAPSPARRPAWPARPGWCPGGVEAAPPCTTA